MRAQTAGLSPEVVECAASLPERLRARGPRVHCITNTVAQAFTANMLLAAGAVPSMTLSADEIGAFVRGCDALLVNLGTLDDERRAAIEIALAVTSETRRPVVLDPVFVDRSPPRLEFARALAARNPTVLRLNGAEFQALAECAPDRENLRSVAGRLRCTLALTGVQDCLADGARYVTLANGHSLMSRVTAMGCAGSALVAAALTVESDPFLAASGALLMLGVAGEIAAEESDGPGTFAAAILDRLYNLGADDIRQRARVMS
jgi:hydroxyethylthiazole kinase